MMVKEDLNSGKAVLGFCGGLKFALSIFSPLLYECSYFSSLFWFPFPSLFY
jgi:hypothetical protein